MHPVFTGQQSGTVPVKPGVFALVVMVLKEAENKIEKTTEKKKGRLSMYDTPSDPFFKYYR
jgi:hypothetical protein